VKAQGARWGYFRYFGKPLLILGSTVFALGIAEVGLRLVGLAPEVKPIVLSGADAEEAVYQRSTNPILGYELKANYHNDNPSAFSYSRTNAHGQRDIERSVDKPSGVRRILILGDSVVEGHGLAEIDDTISRRLEISYTDGNTEVLNFGVSGYCTRSEVELLQTKGLRFDPDAVVVVFTENDFDNFIPDMRQVDGGFDRPAWSKQLFLHSHLFRLLCLQFNLFHFAVETDPQRWSQQAIGENNVLDALERLQEISQQHQLPVLIAIWPRFEDDRIKDMHFMQDDSDQLVVEQLAAMHGIRTVCLSDHFRKHIQSQSEPVNPRLRYTANGDQIHPSVEGSDLAARILKEVLEDETTGARIAKNVNAASAAGASEAADAVKLALDLGKKPPNQAGTYTNMGKEYEEQGDLIRAMEYYQMALEEDPACIAAVFNVGVVHTMQGQPEKAASQFRRAIQLDPSFGPAHKALALVLIQAGDFERAAKEFEEALRIHPNDAEVHCNYGTALRSQKRFDDAVVHLKRAIELKPDLGVAHKMLGMTLLNQKKVDQALDHFQAASRLTPADAQIPFNMGIACAQKGDLADAEVFFKKAVELNPSFSAARIYLEKAQSLRKGNSIESRPPFGTPSK
jgi:tetratricopeptide (TPR) repeat protein